MNTDHRSSLLTLQNFTWTQYLRVKLGLLTILTVSLCHSLFTCSPVHLLTGSPVDRVTWSPVSHFIHTWAVGHKYLGIPKLHHHILAAPAGRHLPPSSTVNKTSRDRVETRRCVQDLWENCQPEEKDETRRKYQINTWRASEDVLYKTQILIMTKFWGQFDVCSASKLMKWSLFWRLHMNKVMLNNIKHSRQIQQKHKLLSVPPTLR